MQHSGCQSSCLIDCRGYAALPVPVLLLDKLQGLCSTPAGTPEMMLAGNSIYRLSDVVVISVNRHVCMQFLLMKTGERICESSCTYTILADGIGANKSLEFVEKYINICLPIRSDCIYTGVHSQFVISLYLKRKQTNCHILWYDFFAKFQK